MSETIFDILGEDYLLQDADDLVEHIYTYAGETFESEDAVMIFQLFYLSMDKNGCKMDKNIAATFARVLRWYFRL